KLAPGSAGSTRSSPAQTARRFAISCKRAGHRAGSARVSEYTLGSGVVYGSCLRPAKLGNGKGGDTGVNNDRARTVPFRPEGKGPWPFLGCRFDLEPGASHGHAVAVAGFLQTEHSGGYGGVERGGLVTRQGHTRKTRAR